MSASLHFPHLLSACLCHCWGPLQLRPQGSISFGSFLLPGHLLPPSPALSRPVRAGEGPHVFGASLRAQHWVAAGALPREALMLSSFPRSFGKVDVIFRTLGCRSTTQLVGEVSHPHSDLERGRLLGLSAPYLVVTPDSGGGLSPNEWPIKNVLGSFPITPLEQGRGFCLE